MAFTLAQVVQTVNRLSNIWRNRNLRVGYVAETAAKLYFYLHGYKTFQPQLKHHVQIDLLMRRGSLLVVAEVKYRPNLGQGLVAVSAAQARRLSRAASSLAAHYPHLAVRSDVLILTPGWPFIHHLQAELDG